MAVGTVTLYAANLDDMRLQDLPGVSVRLALLGSAHVPDDTVTGDAVWADVSADELAAAFGYAAGGDVLANVAVTGISGGWKLSSDGASWTATGGALPAWRYAVIYVDGVLWGKSKPLLGIFRGETTGDVPPTSEGNPLVINCPAAGWFDFVRA